VQQAKSVLEQRAILLPPEFLNPASQLPTAPIELYFDIEAEPSLNLDYLLGVLVIDRQAKTEKFYPLVAEHPDQEALIWQQFLDLVWTYPEAPIFHFSNYEMDTIKRLGKLYQTPSEQVNPVLDRLVDMHQQVTEKVTLPVEGYSLKALASWMGFTWRDPQANGSQSICWYDEWLKTSDRALLDAILRYNEDDCRATYEVKDWLVGFLRQCEQRETSQLS
jgi:predicted RecB family nuclease